MEIEVVSPIEAEAEVQKYTLVSDDIYVRRYDSSTIPTWYRDMIETLISQDPTIADVNSALDYLTSVDNGYNVNFANLDTWQASTNALLTTLGSNLDGNTAAIANIQTTYATKTEASAISTNAVQAYLEGGSANAWFTNKISTYASDIASNASDITTLSATLDGHTVSINTIDSIVILQGEAIESLDTSLATVIDTYIPELQAQIDGQITSWFYNGVPTLSNAPANSWLTDIDKSNHVGDIYYDKLSGYGYRFAHEDINDTPDMGVIYSWVRIVDTDVTLALHNASVAQSTADGKATVYYSATAPTGLTVSDVGDMWVNSSTKVTQTWNGTTWVNVTTVDAVTSLAKLADLEEARDGVIDTFYVATAPASGMSYGDYWVETNSWNGTKYNVYRYENANGSSTAPLIWNINTGETAVSLGKAYRADVLAGTAQATADGKVKTWYQTSAPTGLTTNDIGDLWVDTDNGNLVQVWSGTTWVDQTNTTANNAQSVANTAIANASAAQATANTASANATSALSQLTDIASDNILSPVEKSTVIADYAVITAEQSGIDTQATNYSITTEKTTYDTAVSALTTYLGTLTSPVAWNVTTGNTTIVGSTFRSKFSDVYTARQTLLNKIAAVTKTLADTAQSTANTAYTWSANASKLITAPDGSVTGWSFGDGSNVKSYFQIQATNFKISDGTTGYTPFSIVGSDILFNGKVSFANVTNVPSLGSTPQQVVDAINTGATTTIDGGKITTGSVAADQINAYAITGKSIIGGTIDGAAIKGVTITGAVIKASYIDLTDQSYLTNWQSITDINTIPSQYWGNFAVGDNGLPITDAMGYYRLVTSVPLVAPATSTTSLSLNTSTALPVYSYDYYQVLAKKPISNTFKLVPYLDYGWKTLIYGKVWNANNWSEYWGNDMAFSTIVAGNEIKIEGYVEKTHYGDLVYNTVYLKYWLNGTLITTANASGGANGNENGIPATSIGWDCPVFTRYTINLGSVTVAVNLYAINGTYSSDSSIYYNINGTTSISGIASTEFTRFMSIVGSLGGSAYSSSPAIAANVEIYTPYPAGGNITVNAGYTGPLLTYTHYENPYTWTWNNCPIEIKYQNESYKIEQA